MNRFKTKNVVITGAGSGLGRGLALNFAKMGWRVAVSDINMQRAEESLNLVRRAGGSGITVGCDVTKSEAVECLADEVIARMGSVDILINNAGVPVAGLMEKISIDDWKYEIDIMLMSAVYGCKSFIPILKKQGWGQIVNVASAAGIFSLPEMAPYNVTKAAVISLSETLRAELRGNNIGVTVVCPTFFKARLLEQARFADERQMKMASAFFEKFSFGTIESVSRATMKAIRKNRLYCIPQPDAKLFRFLKRMTPQLYHDSTGILHARGYLDKILSIET